MRTLKDGMVTTVMSIPYAYLRAHVHSTRLSPSGDVIVMWQELRELYIEHFHVKSRTQITVFPPDGMIQGGIVSIASNDDFLVICERWSRCPGYRDRLTVANRF